MLQILKLGGSVITEKNKYRTPKTRSIRRLIKEIKKAKEKEDFNLILVNGAGSFGHIPAKKHNFKKEGNNGKKKFDFTLVHKDVEDLNRIIWDCLGEEKLTALPVHPSSCIVNKDDEIEKFNLEIIKKLLSFDIIPLLYGDGVVDLERGCSIVSGDDIAPYLADKLEADRVLMGTNTDGIFDKDPNKNDDAKHIEEVTSENYKEVLKYLDGSNHVDVTGGMKEKFKKLVKGTKGIDCFIYNACKKENTKKALLGERVGTLLRVD